MDSEYTIFMIVAFTGALAGGRTLYRLLVGTQLAKSGVEAKSKAVYAARSQGWTIARILGIRQKPRKEQ